VTPQPLLSDSLLLLPEPESGLDSLSMMYVLMSDGAALNAKVSQDQILQASEQNDRLMQQFIKELEKAAKAEKKGGFWGDLAGKLGVAGNIVSVVAVVGLTVATGGTGAVALAVVGGALSLGAMAEGEYHFIQKGLNLSDKQAGWLVGGMAIGGALMTGGGALMSAGGAGLTTQLTSYAAVGGGAITAAGGGAQIAAATYGHEAAEHNINATEIQADQDDIQRLFLTLIADLEENAEAEQVNVGRFTETIQTEGDTLIAIAEGV
jgi:hypothetical protein